MSQCQRDAIKMQFNVQRHNRARAPAHVVARSTLPIHGVINLCQTQGRAPFEIPGL